MTKRPCSKTKRSLLTKSRSEEFFTGRNRERGTSMPWAFLKCFTAEPAAVSSLKAHLEKKKKSAKHRRRDPNHLNHWSPIVQHLRIGNDVQLHFAVLQDALKGFRNRTTVVNKWESSKYLIMIYPWGWPISCWYWISWISGLNVWCIRFHSGSKRQKVGIWPELKSSMCWGGTWVSSSSRKVPS